jgi:hypothetical protein
MKRGKRASSKCCLLAAALAGLAAPGPAQDYRSSVVGTDFDFILDSDPSTFTCLESKGHGPREMPDKTRPSPLVQLAFIFVAYFRDGTSVDIALDADFETQDAAREEALRYAPRIGKLPTALRRGIERVVVHRGEEDATAFSDSGLIVLYSDNATKRISTHDLEETLFHESVHASWDGPHRSSAGWRAAQAADGAFVTHYAKNNPDGEDLAESALFAYALIHHPERIPAADAERIRTTIPARIAFVEGLIPRGEPLFQQVGPEYACDGSGTTFAVSAERFEASRRSLESGNRASSVCSVDLTNPGELSDIVSNALMRGLDQDSVAVRSFLDGADFATAEELLEATVAEFGIERSVLDAGVLEFLHCNCRHELEVDERAAEPRQPTSEPGVDADSVRSILCWIAALLALSVAVNVSTLIVLVKRSRRERPAP